MAAGSGAKDLEWLVDRRSKIQRLLLDLHSCSEKRSGGASQRLRLQLLIAVGFALWRAAFLAEGKRRWPSIDKDATLFLETLVRDNAIGYAQDRRTKAWSFGYYVNDAYLRLAYFAKLLELKPAHARRIASFLAAQSRKLREEPHSHAAWDHAYDAALDAFALISGSRRRDA